MFPVRSTMVPSWYRPGITPSLGDIDIERFKSDIKKAVIKTIAVQMAVSLSISITTQTVLASTVVLAPLAALMGVWQSVMGKHYEKRIKERVAQVSANIERAANASSAQINSKMSQVYQEVLPTAQVLASGTHGLGDVWSRIKKETVRAVPKVVKVVRLVAKAPITLQAAAVREIAHVSAQGLKSVGLTSAAKAVDKAGGDIKTFADNAGNDAYNLLSGREPWVVADAKCGEIERQAYAQINAETAKALNYLDSPQGKNDVLQKTVAALQGDPSLIQQAYAADQAGAAERAQAEALKAQLPKTSSPLPLIAGVGAAAAMLFFSR